MAGSKGASISNGRYRPPTHRVCACCGERKRLSANAFYVAQRDAHGKPKRYDSICKGCKKAIQRDRYRNVPGVREAALAKAKRVREEDQRRRAEDAAYAEARRARWREYNRADRERRRNRRGVAADAGVGGPRLPAAPLAAKIDLMVREQGASFGTNGASIEIVCGQLGIHPRQLYAWREGEVAAVQFDLADRVMLNADLDPTDIWDAGDLPDWLVEEPCGDPGGVVR